MIMFYGNPLTMGNCYKNVNSFIHLFKFFTKYVLDIVIKNNSQLYLDYFFIFI